MPKLAANLLSKATELTATVTGDAEFALKANKCLSTSKLTYCEPDEHLLQIADRPTPPPAEEMTKNKSWMQCAFKNMMEFTVEPLREYTHIGRYEDIPSRIEPFDQGVFTCYGSDGTGAYFYGVSGGRVFCVRLEAYYDFYFAIGFTDLYDGTRKASVRHPSPGLLPELQQDYYPSEKMNKLQRSAARQG